MLDLKRLKEGSRVCSPVSPGRRWSLLTLKDLGGLSEIHVIFAVVLLTLPPCAPGLDCFSVSLSQVK